MQSNFELPQARDARIDLFRGFALLAIFIDHVPSSVLVLLTPHAFAFSDAGELFFFLSGFVSALVYGKTLRQSGFVAATLRIWRRAWTLYIAQILLLFFLIAEVSLGVIKTGDLSYHAFFRSADFILQPDLASLHALLLGFQPAYLDIIPCYIIFLLGFPLVLAALARSACFALIPSFALYLGVQVFGWNLVTFPRDDGWFFDPLAWQFLFVLGAAFGSGRLASAGRVLSDRRIVRIAAALTLVIGTIQLSTTLHTIWPSVPALLSSALPIDKSTLAPLRLVSFFALAVVARRLLQPGSRFLGTDIARGISRCGRHSLSVFCLGVVLAIMGYMLLEQLGRAPTDQLFVAGAGIAILIAAARGLDWLSLAFQSAESSRFTHQPAALSARPFSNGPAMR
ncbi:MAG TPA: OpgC domain-containing protein [Alphaproteobacteria bacterium]|nr:OpgC domain-containing protein [Alphaproteobacteria bacterium]